MSAWRGQEQHIILFVTSGGLQADLTILAYLTEDGANSPAVRNPVSLYLQNYYYRSYYYYYYYYYCYLHHHHHHHHYYCKKKDHEGPEVE